MCVIYEAEWQLVADCVEKVRKIERPIFRRKSIVPWVSSECRVRVTQSFIQRKMGRTTVPPAEILDRSLMKLRFFRQPRKKTFSTQSALFEHEPASGPFPLWLRYRANDDRHRFAVRFHLPRLQGSQAITMHINRCWSSNSRRRTGRAPGPRGRIRPGPPPRSARPYLRGSSHAHRPARPDCARSGNRWRPD